MISEYHKLKLIKMLFEDDVDLAKTVHGNFQLRLGDSIIELQHYAAQRLGVLLYNEFGLQVLSQPEKFKSPKHWKKSSD